ncbi:MAG: hypothetical protein IJQ49_07060, partial [Prevotella sp.]|nr:hypothetical protein [Prevotella sp.]
EHMLEWFELTNVEVKPKEKKSTRDKQPDDIPVNVIHLYLDGNYARPVISSFQAFPHVNAATRSHLKSKSSYSV